MMRILSALAFASLSAAPLVAQTPPQPRAGEEMVDRVIAVVGDTTLLLSDLQTALQQMEAAGRSLPTDPVQRDAVAQGVLEDKINDLVLVEAARDAGITVADEEVRAMVDQEIRSIVQRFGGSEVRFTQALASSGMTLTQYRQILEQQFRDQQLVRSFISERMRNRARPLVTEEQLREAFQQHQAQLGTRPARVSFRQVVVKPEPSDSARAKALRTAEDVLTQLREGADFEVMARRFSEDPGSREHGGDLGWFKQGRMVKEFENMVFAMRPGTISPIVKTDFGYHIIKLEKVRGPERQARHILIKPEVTPQDVQRARERADSVATAIRDGANPLTLARAYGNRSDEAEVTRFPVPELPPTYQKALEGAEAGSVVGPVELQDPTGTSWAVIRLDQRQAAGPYTLDDVREQLVTRLQEEHMMEQIVADLRRSMYVHVMR